jgi:hypothetical protein
MPADTDEEFIYSSKASLTELGERLFDKLKFRAIPFDINKNPLELPSSLPFILLNGSTAENSQIPSQSGRHRRRDSCVYRRNVNRFARLGKLSERS